MTYSFSFSQVYSYWNHLQSGVKRAIVGIIFIIGVASPYYFAKFGINFADEPYQIMLARDYHNAPLAFLSAMLGGVWGNIFGWGILSMRYYSVTIQLFALLSACWYLNKRIHRPLLSMFVAGLGAWFLNATLTFLLYGWDATSNAFIVFTLICLLCYFDKPTITRLCFLSIISALTIFCRVPNCIIQVFIFVALSCFLYNRISFKSYIYSVAIYVAVLLTTIYLMLEFAFGGINEYIYVFKKNSITNHAILDIIFLWFDFFQITLPKSACVWGLALCSVILAKSTLPNILRITILILSIPLFWFLIFEPSTEHYLYLNAILYGYFSYLIFIGIFGSGKKIQLLSLAISQSTRIQIITILFFSFASAFGSNCPFAKTLSVSLVPLALIFVVPKLSQRKICFSLIFPILIIPCVIGYRSRISYFDSGTTTAVHRISNPYFKDIYTVKQRAKYINRLDSLILANPGRQIFVSDGPERMIGYYLVNKQAPFAMHNWDYSLFKKPDYINDTKHALISSHHPTNLYILNPEEKDISKTPMVSMLDSLKPIKIENYGDIIIYHYNFQR